MKKILTIFAVLFFAVSAASAFTVTVDFGVNPALDDLKTAIENKLKLDDQLGKYSNMPKLARGFANANTYASGASTLRGYQGYDLFGVSIGTMFSLQAPSSSLTFYKDLQDDLDDGDMYAGMGANLLSGQVGINLSFLVNDLYLAFRFGKFNTTLGGKEDDFKLGLDSGLFGILLNYQLIGQQSILGRSMLWRGVSVESGFIYSKNKTSFYQGMDSIEVDDGASTPITAEVDPSFSFIIDNKSYIIPVEAYTSIRLLYVLNLGIGAGFDFVAGGSSRLSLDSDGNAIVRGTDEKGIITIDSGTKSDADKFRGKVMANIGLSAGPVFIDMPVTVYMDNGYSIGLSAGLVW